MPIKDLEDRAGRFGITSVLRDSYLSLNESNRVIESVIVADYVKTPASDYHNGVDVALLRYSSRELNIPDGYYKFRTTAEAKVLKTGIHEAISELIDETGAVIYSDRTRFQVNSVELPGDPEELTAVAQLNSFREELGEGHTFDSHTEYSINYCCKNGTCGTCIGPACQQR